MKKEEIILREGPIGDFFKGLFKTKEKPKSGSGGTPTDAGSAIDKVLGPKVQRKPGESPPPQGEKPPSADAQPVTPAEIEAAKKAQQARIKAEREKIEADRLAKEKQQQELEAKLAKEKEAEKLAAQQAERAKLAREKQQAEIKRQAEIKKREAELGKKPYDPFKWRKPKEKPEIKPEKPEIKPEIKPEVKKPEVKKPEVKPEKPEVKKADEKEKLKRDEKPFEKPQREVKREKPRERIKAKEKPRPKTKARVRGRIKPPVAPSRAGGIGVGGGPDTRSLYQTLIDMGSTPQYGPLPAPKSYIREAPGKKYPSDKEIMAYMATIAQPESGGNYTAKNPLPYQTASGKYQIIADTWNNIKTNIKNGTYNDYGIPRSMLRKILKMPHKAMLDPNYPDNSAIQDAAALLLGKANARALVDNNIPVNSGNMYVMHGLGTGLGTYVLNNPNKSIRQAYQAVYPKDWESRYQAASSKNPGFFKNVDLKSNSNILSQNMSAMVTSKDGTGSQAYLDNPENTASNADAGKSVPTTKRELDAWDAAGDVKQGFSNVSKFIKDKAKQAWDYVSSGEAGDDIETVSDVSKQAYQQDIKPAAQAVGDVAGQVYKQDVKPVLKTAGDIAVDVGKDVVDVATPIVKTAGDVVSDVGKSIVDKVKNKWNQYKADAEAEKKQQSVKEETPPGKKYERMVKHIKKGYAKDGKLTDQEKSIAYATAWKHYNKKS
jgi:hypothetical protein